MCKRFVWLISLMIMLCNVTALAAVSTDTTEYSLGPINAKITLSDSYIVLQEANLGQRPEILSARNMTAEDMQKDWQERHVLLQAWVPDLDACLEIRGIQDADASTYFDMDSQTAAARNTYRSSHLKNETYQSMGYDVKSAEWIKTSLVGRFLQLKYKKNVNGLITWGYAEKTVKNGWTIVLDYQVFGRGLREKDLNSLKKATRTLTFTESIAMPEKAGGLLTFTEVPPTETNVSTFTVEGNTAPGAHVIGTLMKYANPTPVHVADDASEKTGKFKLNFKMPDEGIWLLTLTVDKDGTTLAEHVFETTTYQKTLLPVTLDQEVPEQFEGDQFILSGKTTKGVSIQCIVTGGAKAFEKQIRTNNTGKFKFKIPTDAQSEYQVTLVFQKKNYDTRRFSWTANRSLTERDIQNQMKKEAVKPAYSTLNKKLEAYSGRIMGYKVYITDIQHVGDEYVITAALNKTKKGALKNMIVIMTETEPDFVVGSEQTFYGRLNGSYEVQSEEDQVKYPSFDLLFWE